MCRLGDSEWIVQVGGLPQQASMLPATAVCFRELTHSAISTIEPFVGEAYS